MGHGVPFLQGIGGSGPSPLGPIPLALLARMPAALPMAVWRVPVWATRPALSVGSLGWLPFWGL